MFAPPVAKPKAKTASNDIWALHRATPFGQRHGDVEQAPMFRPLPQVGASLNAHGTPEQDVGPASMSAQGGPPRPSWNFCNVPAYLPGREKPFPMPPGLASRLPIRAKLKVGAVDDPLEHEADRVADEVTRMPAPEVSVAAAPPQVSRKCAACEEEETLQTKRTPSANAEAALDAGAAVRATERRGEPLPSALRSYFEPRFGRDFSRVRVHADGEAATAARAVQARAYTFGRDIVFGSGEYAPATPEGRRLLAHELTHVLQQGGARSVASSEGALIQRQPDPRVHATPPGGSAPPVPFEKRDPGVEAAYRRAGLVKQANAVRLCRESGACDKLLTEAEALQMFSSGRVSAGLGGPPKEAGAPVLAAGALAAPAVQGGAAAESVVTQTAAERAAAYWAARQAAQASGTALVEAAPLVEGGAAAGAGTVAAGSGAAAVVSIAVPVALGLYVVVAVVSLVKWGKFEAELERQGFVILPSPLGVCITNCHRPAAPAFPLQPSTFERPSPQPFGPGSWPQTDADRRAIEEWFRPEAGKQQPKQQPAPQTSAKPVMPPGLDIDKQRRWKECEELHTTYKDTQSDVGSISKYLDPILNALAQNRPVTDQQRIDLCEWLEQMIRLIKRLHRERNKYVLEGCDEFDWFNQGGTEAERRQRHEAELENVDRQLKNRRQDLGRHCPPGAKKSP